MPGLIIACELCHIDLGAPKKAAMIQYISAHQQRDGGWGIHIESPSTMFGSVLNYLALRLLGVSKDDPRAVRGRAYIMDNGSALVVPSWGKFWLAVLGV